jgi:hypothetical protein
LYTGYPMGATCNVSARRGYDIMNEEPKGCGPAGAIIAGAACAGLGAFGGCTMQFLHDIDGGHGGPVYLLSGAGIGAFVGLLAWLAIRERQR